MWLTAPNIHCPHGFSTRHNGVSASPFDSLNLGGSEDSPENIRENRSAALNFFNVKPDQLSYLKQVHGTTVRRASAGQQEGDALVCAGTGLALAVSVADCFPVLFCDEENRVIGAAHAGWRGTVGRIASAVVSEMLKLGATIANIKVAIGQGICKEHFEVGDEVLKMFSEKGFPEKFINENRIDLPGCIRSDLESAGILAGNIWSMERCTFESDFFSYRRDKGRTGRMWGLIRLQE